MNFKFKLYSYFDTVGFPSVYSTTAIRSVGKPSFFTANHVEPLHINRVLVALFLDLQTRDGNKWRSPVRVVTVLTRHPAGPIRVQGRGCELHPYPGQFADAEVLAGLAGELEGRDELAAARGPVLAKTEGRVHALTHPRAASARHHLEAARGNKTREAARADRPPGRPARARPRDLGPGLGR